MRPLLRAHANRITRLASLAPLLRSPRSLLDPASAGGQSAFRAQLAAEDAFRHGAVAAAAAAAEAEADAGSWVGAGAGALARPRRAADADADVNGDGITESSHLTRGRRTGGAARTGVGAVEAREWAQAGEAAAAADDDDAAKDMMRAPAAPSGDGADADAGSGAGAEAEEAEAGTGAPRDRFQSLLSAAADVAARGVAPEGRGAGRGALAPWSPAAGTAAVGASAASSQPPANSQLPYDVGFSPLRQLVSRAQATPFGVVDVAMLCSA